VNLGFNLPAGDVLGVIGPSGCGKSTLARVLVGAWAPLAGKVRLDGADLAQWDKQQLGPHIGYLPQDIQLFAGSIADNIARFAELDTDNVLAAAQMAGVHDLILQLPQGYDTQLGEGGAGLSGGQKQRVAIARALAKNPKLIFADEPTSALDGENGANVMELLRRSAKSHGASVLCVTHDVRLASYADRIITIEDGRILSQNADPASFKGIH